MNEILMIKGNIKRLTKQNSNCRYLQSIVTIMKNQITKIKKTSKFGPALYETKKRWDYMKKKRFRKLSGSNLFIEKNLKIKFSTLKTYKSYVFKGFQQGYDFDKHSHQRISHLISFLKYRKSRFNYKGG